MQSTEDIKQFETAIRTAIKDDSLFEMVNPLEHETLFQQKYSVADRTWIKLKSTLDGALHIMDLLVQNDQPVMIIGGRESSLLCKAFMSTNVNKMNSYLIQPGNEMSKEDCIQEICRTLSKKGENILTPADGVKAVPMIIGLENRRIRHSSCLLTMLADIAKHNFFYSSMDGYRKIKLQNLAVVCQYDTTKNLKTLHSFIGLKYFNVLSLKDNSPLAVLQTHGLISPSLSNELISKTHELYQIFEKKLIPTLDDDNPISTLHLGGLDSFSTCLEMYDKRMNKEGETNAEENWKD